MARGSVFQRNGSYGYRIDLEPDPATGKRRQSSRQGFRTKREAETALRTAMQDVAQGMGVNRSSLDLGAFLDDWLETQRQQLKETTWASYRVAVERIKPALGRRKLKALAPLDIETFYSDLAEAGSRAGKPLSAKSVRNTHVVLRKALADAERLGLVSPQRRRRRQATRSPGRSSTRPGTPTNSSSSSSTSPTTVSSPPTSLPPPPACAEAKCSASGGPTSTSTQASSPSARP